MTGLRRTARALAATAAVALAAAACSSSGGGSGGGAVTGAGPTAHGAKAITVGVLTDVTGPAASGNKTLLSNVHPYDALGLYGDHPIDISERTRVVNGLCLWATRLEGKTFTLVQGADPLCGKTVSNGS